MMTVQLSPLEQFTLESQDPSESLSQTVQFDIKAVQFNMLASTFTIFVLITFSSLIEGDSEKFASVGNQTVT